MYSLAQVLKQEPAAVAAAAKVVLGVLVLVGVLTMSAEALAGWVIAIEALLNLFYVRPLTVSKDALSNLEEP